MHRREFITTSAAVSLVPLRQCEAKDEILQARHVYELLADRNTVFVDFWAIWWATCKSQGRRFRAPREENATYEDNIVFVMLTEIQPFRSSTIFPAVQRCCRCGVTRSLATFSPAPAEMRARVSWALACQAVSGFTPFAIFLSNRSVQFPRAKGPARPEYAVSGG